MPGPEVTPSGLCLPSEDGWLGELVWGEGGGTWVCGPARLHRLHAAVSNAPRAEKEFGDKGPLWFYLYPCLGLSQCWGCLVSLKVCSHFYLLYFRQERKPLQAGVGAHLYTSCCQEAELALAGSSTAPSWDTCWLHLPLAASASGCLCLWLHLPLFPSPWFRRSEVPRCGVAGYLLLYLGSSLWITSPHRA